MDKDHFIKETAKSTVEEEVDHFHADMTDVLDHTELQAPLSIEQKTISWKSLGSLGKGKVKEKDFTKFGLVDSSWMINKEKVEEEYKLSSLSEDSSVFLNTIRETPSDYEHTNR